MGIGLNRRHEKIGTMATTENRDRSETAADADAADETTANAERLMKQTAADAYRLMGHDRILQIKKGSQNSPSDGMRSNHPVIYLPSAFSMVARNSLSSGLVLGW